jgi:hypothetical protein
MVILIYLVIFGNTVLQFLCAITTTVYNKKNDNERNFFVF